MSKKQSPTSRKPSSKRKKTKTSKRSWFGWACKWIFVFGLWSGIALSILLAWYASELPDITKQANFERKTSITIKASDGTVLTRYGDITGHRVGIDDIPSNLIYAVLSIEDRRFYSHYGIDPVGLARAMLTNVKQGRFVQGGSTITQQLAKNLFLSHERTLKRKIQEAMLAIWLEYELSKDEILTAYMNRVYLGAGTYGMDAAAQLYFGKPLTHINLREAAILAGLLKAPSRYSPSSSPERAKARSETVLAAMADAGYISKDYADDLSSLPVLIPPSKAAHSKSARYFTNWVVDGLDELIGTPKEDLIIETTLHPIIQGSAESALSRTITEHGEKRNVEQGAALIMQNDGAVLAMAGGKSYRESQFNRAIQAKRQPGSAFKPFVFLSALEQGWRPSDTILDAPITEGSYRPSNFNDKYYGEVSLEAALMLSMNTAAVRLMDEIGRGHIIDTARRAGIISPVSRNLSSALGSSSVSLLEITTAYAAISSGGLRVLPYAITRITDKNGHVYYERPSIIRMNRVIEPAPAAHIKTMMQSVIDDGTGRRAALPFAAAGKTGTSQDFRDAWFIGFTDTMVGGVWLGNDDNAPTKGVTGGSLPAEIWKSIMLTAHHQSNGRANLLEQDFNSLLGRLLSGGNSHEDNTHAAQEQIYWNSQRLYND